ncbi:hypothetical protein H5410_064083 [Solanum commersonii]|uniref:Uncharacterized protein n=1 Tax=Solanum commersonii TaxID=4109 RepID=A0A9J5W0M0_SOLCO|nr:hypothetical protein H5410_064083 [Solanum commersonii]
MTHFLDQPIPRAGKSPFYRFSCAIVLGFFGDPEFQPQFSQKISRTPVKTLPIDLVGPHGQNNPFYGQTVAGAVHGFFGEPEFQPHFCQNFTWTSVKILPREPVSPQGQNDPFSGLKSSERPLKPYLWSQLDLTAKTAHFQGQMIPRAGKPPPFCRFSCAIVNEIFCQEFRTHFCQNFPGLLLIPYLWSQLALMAKMTNFQGQTIPGVGKPPILLIFIYYSSWIVWRSRIPTSYFPKFYLDVR